MNNRIIRTDRNNTITQSFMTNPTNPLFRNDNPAIPSALAIFAQEETSLGIDELGASQGLDDAGLRDGGVGGADAAREVGCQVRDGEVVGDEGERGCGGEAGAVAREEREGRV